MKKIAHIINPVKVEPSSDLYKAQPITFETMKIAREFARGKVSVDLYATQYPEDKDIVPKYFMDAGDLLRSVLDLRYFRKKRKLPLLKDILDNLYKTSDADFFIYTNVDIALMPFFYLTIGKIIDDGLDGFVVNRRSIDDRYTGVEEIPLMYADNGKSHIGFDCFVFKRNVYSKYRLGSVCTGIPLVGAVLLWNVILYSKQFMEFKDAHLTFHIGNNRIWMDRKYSDYKDHNKNEAYSVLRMMKKEFGSLERLQHLNCRKLFDLHKSTAKPELKSDDFKFLFIAGLHRSGTSILSRCLAEHPLISGFKNTGVPEDEGQFLQTVFPPAKHFGGPGKFGCNPQMHLTENSSLVTYQNKEKLFAEWGRYWNFSKLVMLEKSPPNLLKTRFLQAMFPNCYFVVVVRNPIAVSYSTQKWTKTPINSLLDHWIECHKLFLEDKNYLKNCFCIKYENFVSNPDLWLKRIYDFIDIHNYQNRLEIDVNANEKYLKQWKQEKNKGNMWSRVKRKLQCWKIIKQLENKYQFKLDRER